MYDAISHGTFYEIIQTVCSFSSITMHLHRYIVDICRGKFLRREPDIQIVIVARLYSRPGFGTGPNIPPSVVDLTFCAPRAHVSNSYLFLNSNDDRDEQAVASMINGHETRWLE